MSTASWTGTSRTRRLVWVGERRRRGHRSTSLRLTAAGGTTRTGLSSRLPRPRAPLQPACWATNLYDQARTSHPNWPNGVVNEGLWRLAGDITVEPFETAVKRPLWRLDRSST